VPVGAVVDLDITADDVLHSWWIPALGGKIQAIPGHPNTTWFQATKQGNFEGQCAELCGAFHASMVAAVDSGTRQHYEHYLATWKDTIGQQIWSGSCATCHGNLGQGGYGPNIASNPALKSEAALRSIVHNGVIGTPVSMPPVGDTWTPAEFRGLSDYVRKHIYNPEAAGATGATSGG
jgi:cytochrome c oxidase subunit 2